MSTEHANFWLQSTSLRVQLRGYCLLASIVLCLSLTLTFNTAHFTGRPAADIEIDTLTTSLQQSALEGDKQEFSEKHQLQVMPCKPVGRGGASIQKPIPQSDG